MDDLLETVALVAEVEQLMSNPDRAAAGTVLEAYLDRRVGPIATLLVQTGTLRVGDVVVAGSAYGKVTSAALCLDSCCPPILCLLLLSPILCLLLLSPVQLAACVASCYWCTVSPAVLAEHFCFARDSLDVNCIEHAAACVCKFALS